MATVQSRRTSRMSQPNVTTPVVDEGSLRASSCCISACCWSVLEEEVDDEAAGAEAAGGKRVKDVDEDKSSVPVAAPGADPEEDGGGEGVDDGGSVGCQVNKSAQVKAGVVFDEVEEVANVPVLAEHNADIPPAIHHQQGVEEAGWRGLRGPHRHLEMKRILRGGGHRGKWA